MWLTEVRIVIFSLKTLPEGSRFVFYQVAFLNIEL